MTVGQTTTYSNSIRTQYLADYIEGAAMRRLYDQLAYPVGKPMSQLEKGSSVQVNFLSDLAPATSVISQVSDVTPVTMRDATATVTPTSRANAIQDSELLLIEAYTDYVSKRYKRIGDNMMESVDLLAQAAALTGGLKYSYVARASLDAGTAAHRLSSTIVNMIDSMLLNAKCPPYMTKIGGRWVIIAHPDAIFDLRQSADILAVGEYQKAEIVLNQELGEFDNFKIVASPFAKVFGAAGVDNGTAVATTLSAAANALAKQIVVASASNITVGRYLTIGTEETGSTHYETNERVRVSDDYSSGTTVDIIGEGANGGLRFDHAAAAPVRNADSVYPVVFGGPQSLAKVFATEVGEYGQIVGPRRVGLVDQWATLGWKYYGGYGVISESWLARAEVSSSLDA
jgi:N4-gp56 family major capsid protein